MKVCVRCIPQLSRAMDRVSLALARYAPTCVEIVAEPEKADLQVLHVIGLDSFDQLRAPEYVVIQYCGAAVHDNETGKNVLMTDPGAWGPWWDKARLVWSYYDLRNACKDNFYYAPLGVANVFIDSRGPAAVRDIAVMSSGFVTGPGAEAIEETALAADRLGLQCVHLGPSNVENMATHPKNWTAVLNISDYQLRQLYERTEWVSALRYVEGFELPALEALMCGARPIVFHRPDMIQWYDGHAAFVEETSGPALVDQLVEIIKHRPAPVTVEEKQELIQQFSWQPIITRFWERVLA